MTREEIISGNKLIAEFMAIKNADGSLYCNEEGGYMKGTLHFNTTDLPLCYLNPKEHKYFDEFYGKWERDWNYLMSAVNTIRATKDSFGNFHSVQIGMMGSDKSSCTIKGAMNTIQYHSPTLIESTWRCVVDFIIWWNEHPHNPENITTNG